MPEFTAEVEWFLCPRPGWMLLGGREVEVQGMSDEDIWCLVDQLMAERMGWTED